MTQTDGMSRPRCGSLARRAWPVALFDGPTTQSFEPIPWSAPEPVALVEPGDGQDRVGDVAQVEPAGGRRGRRGDRRRRGRGLRDRHSPSRAGRPARPAGPRSARPGRAGRDLDRCPGRIRREQLVGHRLVPESERRPRSGTPRCRSSRRGPGPGAWRSVVESAGVHGAGL